MVVEVPKGSRNKYELDHATGHVWLDRMLFTATRFPGDYGYVDGTLGEDGDPLDALVLLDEPTFPGCHIRCRALGLFRMTDEAGPDAKVLAVPATDPRLPWTELEHVPAHLLDEIAHFFDIYKDLEPGKHSVVHAWAGRDEAERRLQEAVERAASA